MRVRDPHRQRPGQDHLRGLRNVAAGLRQCSGRRGAGRTRGLALVPDASPLPARVLFVEQRTARVRMTLGEEVVTTF